MRDTTRRPGLRLVRVAVATLAALSLTLGAAPGHAAPRNKLGAVRNLTVDITKPSAYRLAARWDTLVGATSYQVSLSSGGVVLASERVTQASWALDAPVTVGSTVSVKVVAYNQNRPGRAATTSKVVPDLTPPTGSYTVALTGLTATVTQTDVADDLSADSDIVRQIDWDNGAGWRAWNTGLLPMTHLYPLGPAAYHPRVRLTDQAGNVAILQLRAISIGDVAAPLGVFTAAPGSAWAKYTEVTVAQLGLLSDDVSAAADIVRVIDWRDGTSSTWTEGTELRHVYTTPGSYAPVVRLTDEAGKWTDVVTTPIEVQADSVAPKSSVTVPTRARSVRAWKQLTGTASDAAGTGVRNVKVRIAEKRAGAWFAYLAPSRTWAKSTSKAAALRRSRGATVVPVDGVWSYSVSGLRKGTLVTKVRGTDNVGNRSKPRTYEQSLTRR